MAPMTVEAAPDPRPSPGETPDRGDAEERRRRLIHQVHGDGARIRLLSEAATVGAPVFVVDFDDGPRHCRLLGTFRADAAPPSGAGAVAGALAEHNFPDVRNA